jgi:predicted RNA-binding protein
MFVQALTDLIDAIKTVDCFEDKSVFRGEVGKINTVKKNGCIVMPDFDVPDSLTGDPGEYSKKIPLIATCFIISAFNKTQIEGEDIVLRLVAKTIDKVSDTEMEVSMNGNRKYYRWELKRIEWHDRSASLTVISCDFFFNIQV